MLSTLGSRLLRPRAERPAAPSSGVSLAPTTAVSSRAAAHAGSNTEQHCQDDGASAMTRVPCPRCRGRLVFTAEDDLPRFQCLMCGRGFVPARAPLAVAKAA